MAPEITRTMLLAAAPFAVLHLSLAIFSLVKLYKEGSKNLNTLLWTIIILFFNLAGPILFLLVERVKDHD